MTNHNWKNEEKIIIRKKGELHTEKSYTVGCCAFGSMINAYRYIYLFI